MQGPFKLGLWLFIMFRLNHVTHLLNILKFGYPVSYRYETAEDLILKALEYPKYKIIISNHESNSRP